MATIDELVSRTYEHLENNLVFWTRFEVITNGLNPAARLLACQDKSLVVKRVALSLAADQCFYDLRQSGTTGILKLHRVVIGDDTTDTPDASQGRVYRLRPANLRGLRMKSDWLAKRQPYPTHYARWGLFWLLIHPRPSLAHTVTLAYSSVPTPMGAGVESANDVVDLPDSWTELIPEIAAALLLVKEGAGESTEALNLLARVLDPKDMARLKGLLTRQQQKTTYAAKGAA